MHDARVALSQDADVADGVFQEPDDAGAGHLQALLALAEPELFESAIEAPTEDYYGDHHHGVHDSVVRGVHGCISGWYQIRTTFLGNGLILVAQYAE